MDEVLNDILEELKKLNFYNKKVFTQEEAAEYLNTHSHKISELRQVGLLVGIKIGSTYNFSIEELERFVDNYQGYDLSNRKAMIVASQKKRAQQTDKLSRFSSKSSAY